MSIQSEAEELRKAGFALARIALGEKKPTDKNWVLKSMEAKDFHHNHALAIMCGPLSRGGLVGLDLDDNRILEPCRAIMPHTEMKDGREGREESHWFYQIYCNHWPDSVLPERGSITGDAMRNGTLPYFMGSRHIRGADGRSFDLIGAGGCLVSPPSLHKSGVCRKWVGGHRGEPTKVSWDILRESLNELALAIGWKPKQKQEQFSKESSRPIFNSEPRFYRAKKYLDSCLGGAGDGSGGGTCLKVCSAVAVGFGLGSEAFPLLMNWSRSQERPYRERDIKRAIDKALITTNRPIGYMLEATR